MASRRDFLRSAAALSLIGAPGLPGASAADPAAPALNGNDDRRYWVSMAQKIAQPVLEHLAAGQLKKSMPVESSGAGRANFTHLEAFGRLLCGIAPWLAVDPLNDAERRSHQHLLPLAQRSLDSATDPKSPDLLNFSNGSQALVDAAFLAQGILRAKAALWSPLEPRVQQQIVAALKATRAIATPAGNNWVMFAATVEAALLELGEAPRHDRLETEIRRMLSWYKGDGVYGDGAFFHCDYYNAFVIHPMLLDSLAVLLRHDARFEEAYDVVLRRARRYAQVQERLIAPDGTFPSVGRSTTYRFGAFQALAQIALLGQLPDGLAPAQVRCALTAVIRRMIEAPGTFDENGWLRIGFCGHQPALGEPYISTGSLYLCSAVFLPLGLPAADPFWNGPPTRWTSQAIWSGEDLRADHAIVDVATVKIPDPL